MEKFRTMEPNTPTFTEQEELRGLSRSVAEIEWLMIILVMLYYVFGAIHTEDKPPVVLALALYVSFVMGFRYTRFFKQESRWTSLPAMAVMNLLSCYRKRRQRVLWKLPNGSAKPSRIHPLLLLVDS